MWTLLMQIGAVITYGVFGGILLLVIADEIVRAVRGNRENRIK